MSKVTKHAQRLADLLETGEMLVLPTVWDTWSAGLVEEAGFSGLTVGSHPVADAIGSSDGENMKFNAYLKVVERIIKSVDLPVSVDVESGYGLQPGELMHRLLEVGAAGANIEDVVHGEGKRVRSRNEHADYIARAREAADEAGVPFVINGRTDAIKLGLEVYRDPLAEAVERIRLMEQAGARAVYPVGITSKDQIKAVVKAVEVPVNVTAHPDDGHGAGDFSDLRKLGAGRVTFGPLWQKWLGKVSAKKLKKWTF